MSPETENQHGTSKERFPVGQRILERIRKEANAEDAHFYQEPGQDVFRALYLTNRYVCIPEDLLREDVLMDIRSLYYQVLDGIRAELQDRVGRREFLWIVVDPSYEDSTSAVLLTEDKFLLHISRKAWHFFWEDEEEMAKELNGWYHQAAERLGVVDTWLSEPAKDQHEFVVTLRIARMLAVNAATPERAAERAMGWRNNENDPDVQLSYEEVLDGTVHRAGEPDDEVFPRAGLEDEPDHRGGGGGHDGGPGARF